MENTLFGNVGWANYQTKQPLENILLGNSKLPENVKSKLKQLYFAFKQFGTFQDTEICFNSIYPVRLNLQSTFKNLPNFLLRARIEFLKFAIILEEIKYEKEKEIGLTLKIARKRVGVMPGMVLIKEDKEPVFYVKFMDMDYELLKSSIEMLDILKSMNLYNIPLPEIKDLKTYNLEDKNVKTVFITDALLKTRFLHDCSENFDEICDSDKLCENFVRFITTAFVMDLKDCWCPNFLLESDGKITIIDPLFHFEAIDREFYNSVKLDEINTFEFVDDPVKEIFNLFNLNSTDKVTFLPSTKSYKNLILSEKENQNISKILSNYIFFNKPVSFTKGRGCEFCLDKILPYLKKHFKNSRIEFLEKVLSICEELESVTNKALEKSDYPREAAMERIIELRRNKIFKKMLVEIKNIVSTEVVEIDLNTVESQKTETFVEKLKEKRKSQKNKCITL